MRLTFAREIFLNLKGIYHFAAQNDKCQEEVWKKGVEFEEGKKDLSSKGLFPLLNFQSLLNKKQR
jgi:hypothetical protein